MSETLKIGTEVNFERHDFSLSEVEIWVKERSSLFTEKLKNLVEVLQKTYKNKIPANLGAEDKNDFTGKDLCIIASEAMLTGVSDLVDIAKYVPGMVSLTYTPLHQIVQISAREGNDMLFIDPTYRQINPAFKEDILIFRSSEISEYYSQELTGMPEPQIIEENHSSFSLTKIPPQEVLDAKNEVGMSMKV